MASLGQFRICSNDSRALTVYESDSLPFPSDSICVNLRNLRINIPLNVRLSHFPLPLRALPLRASLLRDLCVEYSGFRPVLVLLFESATDAHWPAGEAGRSGNSDSRTVRLRSVGLCAASGSAVARGACAFARRAMARRVGATGCQGPGVPSFINSGEREGSIPTERY